MAISSLTPPVNTFPGPPLACRRRRARRVSRGASPGLAARESRATPWSRRLQLGAGARPRVPSRPAWGRPAVHPRASATARRSRCRAGSRSQAAAFRPPPASAPRPGGSLSTGHLATAARDPLALSRAPCRAADEERAVDGGMGAGCAGPGADSLRPATARPVAATSPIPPDVTDSPRPTTSSRRHPPARRPPRRQRTLAARPVAWVRS